jgi:acyl-CoA synthetase (NDP forming)/GNAT superfamily N-acetyltransferase
LSAVEAPVGTLASPAGVVGGASRYVADVLLRDGRSVRIRGIRPDDKTLLVAHFDSLGTEARHFRFMGGKGQLTVPELQYFTEIDFLSHIALVAVAREQGQERIVGVARCIADPAAPHRAELGIAVSDDHQSRGVGSALLEHLATQATLAGVRVFEADMLFGNHGMHQLLARSGFVVDEQVGPDAVHATLPLDLDAMQGVADERAWRAAAASVRGFLEPRSVVVVGVSRKQGSLGRAIVDNLREHRFAGALAVVHEQASSAEIGVPTYRSLADVPGPVDLVVVAVPAAAVETLVAQAGAVGARAVVVISAGFAEVSDAGRQAQDRLRDIARQSGMRLVGPNCMGVVNCDPGVSLAASFAPTFPDPGNVAFLSQSGALGIAVLDHLRAMGLGLSTFVSVGNKADVSGNDLLAYWAEDDRTRVIAMYLESLGNPRRFARLAPIVARRKPIVVVKSGRSAAGSTAARSHSAALSSADIVVDALFEHAGIIRTETLEDLFDVTALLSSEPFPKGRRVGVVTNAGGPGILFADACEAHGLLLPALGAATQAALRAFLPAAASVGNPVDMIASAGPDAYARAMAIVGADAAVDAIVAIYVPPVVTRPEEVAAAIAAGATQLPADKPVLSVFLGGHGAPPELRNGPRPVPVYAFPENAARALAAAARYGRWRERPPGVHATLPQADIDVIRAILQRELRGASGATWLGPEAVGEVLHAAGIRQPATRLCVPGEAHLVALTMGFPLVAKAVSAGLTHKTEVGGVVLGLRSAQAVEHAVRAMRIRLHALGHPLESVLLQRQVEGGVEALVGIVGDPRFGPLVSCGMGGVHAELMRDVVFRMPPLSDADANVMIDGLRLAPLLAGWRGAAPADRDALVDVVQRVAALAESMPEIVDMDLNPVKVLERGAGAVVVDARIRIDGHGVGADRAR